MTDTDRPTHFVFAEIWEPILPLDRGDRYEDPLAAALESHGFGEVTGGGSQLSQINEVEFAGIDIELTNLDDALALTRRVLEQCGAPRGSLLRYERDGEDLVLPFGHIEGLALYLDGVTLPQAVYQTNDINVLADRITASLPEAVGEIRGSWAGPTETSIYLYGPNAEDLYRHIEPVLRAYPLCQNARVVLRHGHPDLNPRTIRLPMHMETP